jgi:hypothetical protein
MPPLATVSGGDLSPRVELPGDCIEACMTSRLDIPNDRQDVGSELRCLHLCGPHACARRPSRVPLSLAAARAAFERIRYSFMPAKAALRSHKAKAARSSNADADGVVGRHL